MKNLFIWLIPACFLFSCGLNSEQEIESVLELPEEKSIASDLLKENDAKEIEKIYRSYEGEIEGGIAIALNFSQIGSVIQGELVYKKIGKPIPIIGTVDGIYFRILEFSDKGEVTGVLSGDFKNDPKNLSWFSPLKRKSLKMELELKESRLSEDDFKGGKVEGKYSYQFGEDGHAGTITVKRVGADSIFYDVSTVTQAPAHNMASAVGTLFLDGNKASVDFKIGKYEDCAYDIYFYKNFVNIEYVDDRFQCGFGHNAHVNGVFKRIE